MQLLYMNTQYLAFASADKWRSQRVLSDSVRSAMERKYTYFIRPPYMVGLHRAPSP
ncbi:hypothetical protein CJ030_MR4G028421 [Morella rubra]|uniref:Uncharacterized protein n=1 Tax=Morella rubra TaxID=262757 RepID=A0A6A1W404_9ROSI|nr:hypothetical protein CJ030_MR4G028421 [Morella rubra]